MAVAIQTHYSGSMRIIARVALRVKRKERRWTIELFFLSERLCRDDRKGRTEI